MLLEKMIENFIHLFLFPLNTPQTEPGVISPVQGSLHTGSDIGAELGDGWHFVQ